MEKIRLLLSGNTNLQYYIDAVNAAGGEATAKYLPDISTDYDGLILCGGNDIDPKYYHQEMNGSVNIDSQGTSWSLRFSRLLLTQENLFLVFAEVTN